MATPRPDRARPATPEEGRRHFRALEARLDSQLPELMTWRDLVVWLRSVEGRHAEVALYATDVPPAPFTLRGRLGALVEVRHELYGLAWRQPVLRDGDQVGSVLVVPRPTSARIERRHVEGRPLVKFSMAMHSSAFFVSVLVDPVEVPDGA